MFSFGVITLSTLARTQWRFPGTMKGISSIAILKWSTEGSGHELCSDERRGSEAHSCSIGAGERLRFSSCLDGYSEGELK